MNVYEKLKIGGSKTLWTLRGSKNKVRVDIENVDPGRRPANLHFQDDVRGIKYRYDHGTKTLVDNLSGAALSDRELRRVITPEVERALKKGLRYLGEAEEIVFP